MSGRGRGRGRSNRGGRGRGNGRGRFQEKKKSTELKFRPHGDGKEKQSTTYYKVFEDIVLKVQRTYEMGDDIASSLRDGKKKDFSTLKPKMRRTTETDMELKVIEMEANRVDYELEVKDWREQIKKLDDNVTKAYALIFQSYCSASMQVAVKELPNFESDIRNDPFKLLEEVQKLMHTPMRARYPLLSLSESLAKVVNLRQLENEELIDYMERFKQERNIARSQLGKGFLDSFIEYTPEWKEAGADVAAQKKIKDEAFERFMAALFLRGANQAHYGKLMEDLRTQYSLGNCQYPKTLQDAVDVMRQIKIGKKKKNTTDRRENDRSGNERPSATESSFAQRSEGRKCYCCGSPDHIVPNCDKKNSIPRDQWFDRTQTMHYQNADNNDGESVASDADVSVQSSRSARDMGWSGLQICHKQRVTTNEKNEDEILLDTGSTISLFKDKSHMKNVHKSQGIMELSTNAGSRLIDEEGQLDIFGNELDNPAVKFCGDAIANIYSLKDLKNQCRVTYDSEAEDAFLAHTKSGIVRFFGNEMGLYTHKPKKSKKRSSSYLQTLEDTKQGFTQRQIKRAEKARKIYHVVGAPTMDSLKKLLRQNLIKNCPVTVDDVNLAEKIFGPDVSTLKGRSTRPRPTTVIEDAIEIPRELVVKNLVLESSIDIMFVNRLPFLTAIDKSIKYRSLIPLDSRNVDEFYRALQLVLRKYNGAGFFIKRIHADGEFKSTMEELETKLDVEINFASPGDHVPEAERNNRVIQERFRILMARLPFKVIPNVMIRAFLMDVTKSLNLFPAKGGISEYYSPDMILSRRNLDYNKYCTIERGAYVQASTDNNPTNTTMPRTIDAIYLRPAPNLQGGHELMDLQSGLKITRPKVTQCAMTNTVIRRVEELAARQGHKTLKFFNRKKEEIIFPDADLTAGVNWREDDEEYEDDEIIDEEEQIDEELNETEYQNIDQEEVDGLLQDMTDEEKEQFHEENETNEEEEDESVEEVEVDNNENVPEIAVETVEDENVEEEIEFEYPDDDDDNSNEDAPEQEDDEEHEQQTRRSTRERSRPQILDPIWNSKSYLQSVLKEKTKKTSSERTGKQVNFLSMDDLVRKEICHNLIGQSIDKERVKEYDYDMAKFLARTMSNFREQTLVKGASYAQQFILKKGLKVLGDRGKVAATSEMDQLYQRNCFEPILVSKMSPSERRKAQEAFMFLTEKRDGSIKGRMVYNGKPTREWISKEDSASPTASTESVFITTAIDAHEGRDVMTNDVPNAFIQTKMPITKDGEDRVIMKITGVLVDMLLELDPETYSKFVVIEKGRKVIYTAVLQAIYGMLVASLLWYLRFRKDLESIGFVFNNYDPCVANRIVNGKQHTIRFHVDDVMSSHINPKVNDKFENWLNRNYGGLKKVTSTRGKVHDYLGMTFDFSVKGKVKIKMDDYVEKMINSFPEKLKSTDIQSTPASNDLFLEGQSRDLPLKKAKDYHNTVAKGLFLCKRARPDIQPTVAVLSTRVKKPKESDWQKLVRMMKYLNGTKKFHLTLSIDNLRVLKWLIDASFAVHPDFSSHSGMVMKMGDGAIQSGSMKQKLNTRSSTEAELVAVDDFAAKILWTRLFIEDQGYEVDKNILYQDNKSAILLEENGRKSAGKRSRHLNIRYFFITDQVKKGNVQIEHCPTDVMEGDFMTKPTQGRKFREFRKGILGM